VSDQYWRAKLTRVSHALTEYVDCKTRYDFTNSRGISVVVPFEIHRAGNGSAAVRELIDATGEF
jgi:hypothetical protein